MKIDGGCHCGHVTYTAEINPDMVALCHCTDCQTMSGSAFRTVAIAVPGSFELTANAPKQYVKTAESGTHRVQAFCAECGTHIYAGPFGDDEGLFGIRASTIRQRAELVPTLEIWTRSRQPWVAALEGARQIEDQRF